MFAEKIGVKLTDEQSNSLLAWKIYAKTCGPLYPYEGVAFVSRRPTELRFDDSQLLHSETGPAMAFGDGYSIYAHHGTRVPQEWIESPSDVSPDEILGCQNVEQRAAGIAIIGMDKMLDKLNHKVIDSDPDPMKGDLIEVRLPDLPDPARYLKAECPRNGTIMEGVPGHISSVISAQAWRVGLTETEFKYPERRT